MDSEIKEILNKFDKVLENYELDKKFGQMSVDSICHLFPNELIIIKNCITNLREENKRLKEIENFKFSIRKDETKTTPIVTKNYKSEYEDYKSRCEKASGMIQFIAFNSERPLTITELNKVYNILE